MIRQLDAAELLARAQSETGLDDYGDITLPARFELVVALLNGLGMDADGMRRAEDVCHWLLTSRLEFFSDRVRYPVADEVIERPMFVTGEPRSGTTLMHALMSVDAHARALRFWEVMYPSPPPGSTVDDDPRRALADADWREINAKMPKWLHSHPYNDMLGDGLPEDERTWAFDFRVMTPTAWWRVPMQTVVGGLPTDNAAQYRIHKAMLQQFQYRRPPKQWVLKGFHGFRLQEFFDCYPDATLLWLHRDPVQVAASRTMMMADILEGIVKENEKLAAAHYFIGMVCVMSQQNTSRALQAFDTAYALNPRLVEAQRQLNALRIKQRQAAGDKKKKKKGFGGIFGR